MSLTQKLTQFLNQARPEFDTRYETYEKRMRDTNARMERLRRLAELKRREAR